jgi:flavin reductase (DIM6/NTAB) family NADH-FMN oxidoreductase RutF
VSALGCWPASPAAPACSAAEAWHVLRQFATGVAVLATGSGPTARGTTVSTLALASRTPPLVSVALRADSAGLLRIKEDEIFTVSVLGAGQAGLARYFATPGRADGLRWPAAEAWAHGIAAGPVLRDAVGWLECAAQAVIAVGDHELVIARVRAAVPGAGDPLVQHGETLR